MKDIDLQLQFVILSYFLKDGPKKVFMTIRHFVAPDTDDILTSFYPIPIN